MNTRTVYSLLILLCLLFTLVEGAAQAQNGGAERPFLHPLFTDDMVLQRDLPTPVWGWTKPGERVLVSVAGKTNSTNADANGRWLVRVGPLSAGGPHTLTVTGSQNVTLRNVLVGDVWICSGQSNMEQGMGIVDNTEQEIAQADHPKIRLFTVPHTVALEPRSVPAGRWLVCTPQNISSGGWGGFSAVAYFFGRHLHKELGVPIGLIHTSWGGTIAEAWTSADSLMRLADFRPAVEQLKQTAADLKRGTFDLEKKMTEWWVKNDPGSASGSGWAAVSLDAAGWKTMRLPVRWEEAGLPDFDGIVWFRREIDLPASAAGKAATLHLGPIDDRDTTWVNGVKVGETNQWDTARSYRVPAGTLKAGRNVLAIRVLDTGGAGGVYGNPEQMRLEVEGEPSLPLTGAWGFRDSAPLSKMTAVPQQVTDNPNVATVLNNGMIAPLLPFGIKGAIWYQGEFNAGRAYQYRELLPTLIRDWRSQWGLGDFPFYIVQLANFTDTPAQPGDDAWAELREAQAMTARNVPNAGLAVAIDIGDAKDIHPRNKQDVGKRLALTALAKTYGRKVAYSGPAYKSMQKDGNAIRLTFDHHEGGLVAKGDKLQGFAVAGEDRKWVWADARIEGNAVVVSSPQVPNPMAVRYAWAANPVCNLYNQAGLPAVPFRTDDWPGVTVNNR